MRTSYILPLLLLGFTTAARAELDPELAEANNKNEGGFFLGGGALIGQAYRAGGSSPGVAGLVVVEPGWVARRDSWKRVEASLEVGAGQLSYRKKEEGNPKVTMPINAMVLAKVGFGWSLGDSLFNLVKLGVGPAIANYEEDGNLKIESDGSMTGLAGMVSYDLVVPMGSAFDITGGFRFTHMSFDLDKVKMDGIKASGDGPVNLNIPAVTVGLRLTL